MPGNMKFSLSAKSQTERDPEPLPELKPLTRGLSNHLFDVMVVGAGAAGLSAGTQAAMAGLDTIVIEKSRLGGGMALLDNIDDFPGVEEGTGGSVLAARMYQMALASTARIEQAAVLSATTQFEYKMIRTEKEEMIGRTVIIATGTRPKEIGLLHERRFLGSGMSYDAYSDVELAANKDVAVIGIGEHAAKTAVFLAQAASLVYLVTGGPRLRVLKKTRDHLLKKHTIEVLREHRAVELVGQDAVTALCLRSIEDESETMELPVAAVFGCGGTLANTEFISDFVTLDETGHVVVDETYSSSLPGVLAAGTVSCRYCPTVANAISDGLLAARHAEEHVYRQMRSS